MKNEKLLEQRLKRATEESERSNQQALLEQKTAMDLKDQEVLNLKHKLELQELEKRYEESSQ